MMILGIDTSNYTTSTALFDYEKGTIRNFKKLLPVKPGEKGLRQSDALFHHTVNMPEIVNSTFDCCRSIDAVGVSVRPRDVESSYMPCFKAGYNTANAVARVLNVPLYEFSHQSGHVAAALFSADQLDLIEKSFIAFHFSGGTSEALLVNPDSKSVFSCRLVSASSDLKAGQVIDRCGVMLGMGFPCGVELEKLAMQSEKEYKIKTKLKDGCVSLSGVENKFTKMLEMGEQPCDIAKFTLDCVYSALDAMTEYLITAYGEMPLVYSGGVMSNRYIRQRIVAKYGGYFAEPEFSADNAAGVAVLTAYKGGYI